MLFDSPCDASLEGSTGCGNNKHILQDAYDKLCREIILAACEDTRDTVKAIEKAPSPAEKMTLYRELKRLERFFNSEWFKILSGYNVDGNYVFTRLCKEEKEHADGGKTAGRAENKKLRTA